ncbi:50S ribosome-binding GTPase [Marihabitans asiaticum]|uniref:50S ribosome-binding GTPase n=1 Tax=Marihabitans asiaticum TaxID=415218 RepID=A0A560W813_9MICO|nr:GTPase [Marihabitans asiaticum]TWD13776.1 50S ribosome-binding GTPase [Marihabitans asiaticum]
MSPIFRGEAKVSALSVEELLSRSDSLAEALTEGGDQLEPEPARRAAEVVEKVRERTSLVGGHTVVALAGATGSGKSSLFNALVGADVAQVGVRRPTTSTPTAAVWGEEPVGDLLDWLGVGRRHTVEGEDSLDSLVLLDLPDFDSREAANREEARRVLELADVFVWVTDPQKYADAVLHDEYVSVLKEYGAVTVAVLNQADRLPDEAAVDTVTGDLSRLLERDGLSDSEVVATSSKTGLGLERLTERLHTAVASADAARHRLGADVATAAKGLAPSVAEDEPDVDQLGSGELVDALARAAGVPTVVDAVRRDFVMETVARTGWPFTRWAKALRPAPLKRLRLDKEAPDVTEADVRAVLGRSSIPPPTPSARAAVDLAARRLGEHAGQGLPTRWADEIADTAAPYDDHLADELDQAVLRTPLRARNPLWWPVLGVLQVLLAVAAVLGLLWLVAIALAAWLQLPAIPTVDVGPFATPFILLAGGIVGGLLVAALGRLLAGPGSRRRAAQIDKRLKGAIAEVAERVVIAPVRDVLTRHARARRGVEAAQRR